MRRCAGFKQKVAGFKASFPDLEEDLQDIIASGNTVATAVGRDRSSSQGFMGISGLRPDDQGRGHELLQSLTISVTNMWTS